MASVFFFFFFFFYRSSQSISTWCKKYNDIELVGTNYDNAQNHNVASFRLDRAEVRKKVMVQEE